MAASSARRRGIIAEINVTPLVDIMLVLLIIFMLTQHLIEKQAIELELPRASNSANAPPTVLAVTLTRDGAMFLNERPVTAEQLRTAVREAVAKDPKTTAIIAGDKAVTHGRIVWVLDTIKSLGITSFAIQIDPAGLTPPPAP